MNSISEAATEQKWVKIRVFDLYYVESGYVDDYSIICITVHLFCYAIKQFINIVGELYYSGMF